MPSKFLILNLDDQIFAPLVDYIYFKNRGLRAPRPGGRNFNLGAPAEQKRQLLWVAADDAYFAANGGTVPANGLFDQMRRANAGEVVVSATHAGVLAGVQDNEQVYVCLHGQYDEDDCATDRVILKCAAANGAFPAAWFAKFLTDTLGLPAGRRIHLKVFACYSGKGRGDLEQLTKANTYNAPNLMRLARASFAGRLKTSLKGTRPLVTVSGYVGATRLPAGNGQAKRAFGVGHGGHKAPASSFRISFAAGSKTPTLPDGWEDWVDWL